MKLKSTLSILLTTLTLATTYAYAGIAAPPTVEDGGSGEGEVTSTSVNFVCGTAQGEPATLLEGDSTPMIIWKTKVFGKNFKPQERCNIVANKLNQAIKSSGTDWGELNFASGEAKVNGKKYAVVCLIKGESIPCNSRNMVFTLPTLSQAGDAISKLNSFSLGVSDSPLENSGSSGRQFANVRSLILQLKQR